MKKFLVALLGASFVFLAFGMNNAEAKRRGCYARYTYGSKTTAWYNLGKVGGFFKNKKKACLSRAKSYMSRYVKQLFTKSTALCGKKFKVWVDTEVDGKRNSRDGWGYAVNGGYYCKKVCTTKYVKISSCKIPTYVRTYAPYYNRGGYIYKKVTSCSWTIR
ncbi:MAG: hypothetical protein EP343_27370 [Deltaproteobacteria bacterium]|nr:MAG: hypothetical protein EP343_27370 [Deltaproteobacteria bacterium]